MGNSKKPQQPAKATEATEPKHDEVAEEKVAGPAISELCDSLGELFEKHGIKLAMAAFEVPGSKEPAHVFYVGHYYDAAKMTAAVNRQFVEAIRKELI
jgi:hypothetical protein